MADTLVVLRPNATVAAGSWSPVGPITLEAATLDNDDDTYAENDDTTDLILSFDDFTLPDLAIPRSVTPRMRAAKVGGSPVSLSVWVVDELTGGLSPEWSTPLSTTMKSYNSAPNVTRYPGGPAWDQDSFDHLWIKARLNASGVTARAAEFYLDVRYNQAPVATVTGPTGTITTTSKPTATLTYSDPEGDPLERVWWKVFDAATYGAGDFDPETSEVAWDSGELISSATSRQIGVALENNTTYKVYAKVADAGQGGRFGEWDAGPAFTITLDLPNIPVIVAPTADSDNAWVLMGVRAFENVLTANQASLETDLVGWQAGVNASIARSTAQSANLTASLAVTADAGGDMAANTGTGLAAVTASEVWGAVASFRAATTGRECRVDIRWRDEDEVIISTSTGASVIDSNGGWVQSYCVDTAPSDAAFAEVIVNVLSAGAGEVHYVDKIAVRPSNLNLLTLNQANFETDLTGWEAGTNATIGRSQADALVHSGLNSLAVTAVAGGTMAARTPTATNGLPARAVAYTVLAQCRAVSTSRSVNVIVRFYDDAGAQIGVDATTTSPNITNVPGAWTQLAYTTPVAPAGTMFLSIHLQVLLADAGEVHVFDEVSVSRSSSTTWQPGQVPWSRGGLTGKSIELERSDDAGVTWVPVRVSVGTTTEATSSEPFGLTAGQYRTIVVDHSAPSGVRVLYRARSVGLFSGSELTGLWSYAMPATLDLSGQWLKDPYDPSADMPINLEPGTVVRRRAKKTLFEPLGAEFPIPRSDGRKGEAGDGWKIDTYTKAEHDQLDALLTRNVLLLQLGAGEPQRYITVTGDPSTADGKMSSEDDQWRQTSFSWVQVAPPT